MTTNDTPRGTWMCRSVPEQYVSSLVDNVSHIQRIGSQFERLFYTVVNPARGLLNTGSGTKKKLWQRTPFPTPTLLVRRENENENHLTHHLQALYRSWSLSRPYKESFDSSTRPKGVASQNSTLPCALTTFPISLLLSSSINF